LYLLSWRIAPCEVLAGFDTRHDTPPFKSRHHPNSRIAQTGDREGLTLSERAQMKELQREVRELKQANDILRKASAFFAAADLDRLLKR
jgi:transposase